MSSQRASKRASEKNLDSNRGFDGTGRRDLSKGERAMGFALLYPEAKAHRGKRSEAGKVLETESFSRARVSQARSVLRHSRELAEAVRDGTIKLAPLPAASSRWRWRARRR
jgi:hypothetical protein